eukprot:scaffold12689_cov51-Cylindrotheca_fusiformis.AAC.3
MRVRSCTIESSEEWYTTVCGEGRLHSQQLYPSFELVFSKPDVYSSSSASSGSVGIARFTKDGPKTTMSR